MNSPENPSNFSFLLPEWPVLFGYLQLAERRVFPEPVSSGQYGRLALEACTKDVYRLEALELPYNDNLASLLQQPDFKELVPAHVLEGVVAYTLKTGNRCAHHGRRVKPEEALLSLKYLYPYVKWFARDYSKAEPDLPGSFHEAWLPKGDESSARLRDLQEELDKARAEKEMALRLAERLREEQEAAARDSDAARKALEQELAAASAANKSRKARRRHWAITGEFTEAETRRHFIDAALREAGWEDLSPGRELECPVKGMPVTNDNPRGNGFADYVLWDDDGSPLAVIEAKRTDRSETAGLHQVKLYADCLEKEFGQRPILFVSNGHRTQIWDDLFYSAPRLVAGFFSKDDLRWMIQKRAARQDPRLAPISPAIAGRPYQQEGIRRVLESFAVTAAGETGFRGSKRSALMVMATGSGKTRTAAALVDLLIKAGWVRRVLFLADRNALVTQAKNSFAEHLPHLTSIDLTHDKEDDHTRLVFSTYPTMMNQIDAARRDDDSRVFGVGHFDLIFIDEAHRSVYDRYQAIFSYFDALRIGLTATPIDFIDRNTFELFECPSKDPTFHYSLEEAVASGHLVPPVRLAIATQFTREGIAYRDLSPEDQRRYEETFRDDATGEFPEEIGESAMNKWLFNEDTVNKVLDRLMAEGLRIEGGDKLGRTIIFAVNQRHASFIREQFARRYPELPSGFIAEIHNKVDKAKTLIETFCHHHEEKLPQVAVSVDMMDTGVDAPRVLNLLFFKVVRSRAKFEQMMGRGTRLCPDAFGPDQPKTHFLAFDVCGNFEFFSQDPHAPEPGDTKPLSQQIFLARLAVSRLLMSTGDEEDEALAMRLRDMLHRAIATLDERRFQVQMALQWVHFYRKREAWNHLDDDAARDIARHLSGLPVPEVEDERVRRFDLLMLRLQQARLLLAKQEPHYVDRLVQIAEQLGDGTRYGIPAVAQARPLIEQMKDPEFYARQNQAQIEEIRVQIRELVVYLGQEGRGIVYINLEDDLGDTKAVEDPRPAFNFTSYQKRVERFIQEHRHHMTVAKLHTNEPITPADLEELERLFFDQGPLRSREELEATFGPLPLGKLVRVILGMDAERARAAFAEFIQAGSLNAAQLRFVQLIIDYLTRNGRVTMAMLFESPFTDQIDQGAFGLFSDAQVMWLKRIFEEVEGNAEAG